MPPRYTPAQLLAHLRNVYGPQRADADPAMALRFRTLTSLPPATLTSFVQIMCELTCDPGVGPATAFREFCDTAERLAEECDRQAANHRCAGHPVGRAPVTEPVGFLVWERVA